jgi:CDP-diacylglycerol--serine O-phosphatidyltransferase
MKQLPNLITLLNLFFGCIAITYVLQPGIMIAQDINRGESIVTVPEQIWKASLFIGLAALADFFDGFIARMVKGDSEMGKQLDSLADVVSFGVAPSIIIYQFLRLSYAQHENGLEISLLALVPAFLVACAGAYRLARFNIDTEQTYGFKGVPIPAVGLLIASFPLIYWNTTQVWLVELLTNAWFWYAIIFIVSYLMISKLPMMAMKFKTYAVKDNLPIYGLVTVAVLSAIIFEWAAVPIVFLLYVILSLTLNRSKQ